MIHTWNCLPSCFRFLGWQVFSLVMLLLILMFLYHSPGFSVSQWKLSSNNLYKAMLLPASLLEILKGHHGTQSNFPKVMCFYSYLCFNLQAVLVVRVGAPLFKSPLGHEVQCVILNHSLSLSLTYLTGLLLGCNGGATMDIILDSLMKEWDYPTF